MISNWMKDICKTKCSVEFFSHTWLQPSVIARIPGASDERVILGAHLDSIVTGNVNNAPGADDDASGVAGVLEVARLLVESNLQFNRTLEFHFYSAEELGLWGSQAIANAYAKENVNVYAMIQYDMIGYCSPLLEGKLERPPALVLDEFVDRDLTLCLFKIGEQAVGRKFDETACGYACSDHGSWTRAKYRSAFPKECDRRFQNPYIHTLRDTVSILKEAIARPVIEFGVASMIRLSE